jgi:hypothetical protein
MKGHNAKIPASSRGRQVLPYLLLLLYTKYARAICIPIWMEIFSLAWRYAERGRQGTPACTP